MFLSFLAHVRIISYLCSNRFMLTFFYFLLMKLFFLRMFCMVSYACFVHFLRRKFFLMPQFYKLTFFEAVMPPLKNFTSCSLRSCRIAGDLPGSQSAFLPVRQSYQRKKYAFRILHQTDFCPIKSVSSFYMRSQRIR